MRDRFLDSMDGFGVPYSISYETANMILAQVNFGNQFSSLDVDDLQDWISYKLGLPIFDVIIEENRDGVQVGLEF